MDPRSGRNHRGVPPDDQIRARGSRRIGEGGIGLPDSGAPGHTARRLRRGNLRQAWERGQTGVIRVALIAIAIWAMYHIVGSRSGLLQLYSLSRTEASLQDRYAQMEEEYNQVTEEMNEDPSLRMERVMREKYQRSLPGEIVYRIERRNEADSADVVLRPDGGGGR